jgi:hypothetical protein
MTKRRVSYANLTATLALLVALGGGGAYAASVAKNSVGSKQLKTGAVKTVDVKDDGLTGADIDESTLRLPAAPTPTATPAAALPAVFEGPMSDVPIDMVAGNFVDVSTFTYTAPADGYVLVHAEATMYARGTGFLWCLLTQDGNEAAAVYWDTGDVDPAFDLRQTVEGVVEVTKGQHTATLSLREHQPHAAGDPAPTWSQVIRPQIIVEFFPTGSVQTGSVQP